MKPLILITNDDGVDARGIRSLIDIARSYGEVVVMAPMCNASGSALSFTGMRPLRVETVSQESGCTIYACDGTPVDCVKIAQEHFCPRTPQLMLSGINHGSNASINILYSGTMGAVLEASMAGLQAVGFSLLDHSPDADFSPAEPYIRSVIDEVLHNGLPAQVSLNVNIPVPPDGQLRGMRVCRQSSARWADSYEKRVDPHGRPYFWLTGRFECDDNGPETDQWALENGYVSVVPTTPDHTDFRMLETMEKRIACLKF